MENPNILTYLNEAKNSASVISVFSDRSDPAL
ncbi:hypothetical protein SDC9_138999 [bioreactor metagenome]|uniref:Uncharacterized protein n=1 Tax=bioreactor metagenome TaxID=1076179 RepID=A0A645DRG8_9ZZZZ